MKRILLLVVLLLGGGRLVGGARAGEDDPSLHRETLTEAVAQLVALQDTGEWPYEGVYRVRGEIPVGYRVGGTAIVAAALLHAAPLDSSSVAAASAAAIESGVSAILEGLAHPL